MKQIFLTILFLQKHSILFILLIASSCNDDNSFKFNTVITGFLIPSDQKMVYNDESIINIYDATILIRKIEKYNAELDLLEVEISKAEGMLAYPKEDLKRDSALISLYKIHLNRRETLIQKNHIIQHKKRYNIIYKTKDTILSAFENHILILTKE